MPKPQVLLNTLEAVKFIYLEFSLESSMPRINENKYLSIAFLEMMKIQLKTSDFVNMTHFRYTPLMRY